MAERAPARAWYDLVIETIALKGWTKTQLSERSSVSRTAIDKWRTNPRTPQAASVNAVADALGIPRERALRLAGIIGAGPPQQVPDDLVRAIMETGDLTDEQRRAVIEAVEQTLSKERGETGPSGLAAEPERRRPASL